MLPPGEATEHTTPSSALSGTQADSDFFDEPYIRTVKLVRGIPVVTTILRPCAGASSSSSSALSSDQGSSEDYPEIRVSTCGSSASISRLICMVAPNEDQPCHSSSGYPTIGRSGGHNDRARHDRSEVASSFSHNRCLAGNDAQRRITQNRNVWEYGRDRDDLRNIIEDRRHF
jgi:hypothetical protein